MKYVKHVLLILILNSGLNNCNSQNLLPCHIADSLLSLKKYDPINFDGMFEKFHEDDDQVARHQMDSISEILKKEGLKKIKKSVTSIEKQPYQVFVFKYRSKRKRDLFLTEFDQHLLKYQDYWVLDFFLKPGIFIVEKKRKEIVMFRSNNPNILLQFKDCFNAKQGLFLNNSILQ